MLPSSPCTIAHPGGSLLTMVDPDETTPLIVVGPTGNPGEQEVSPTNLLYNSLC